MTPAVQASLIWALATVAVVGIVCFTAAWHYGRQR